MNRIRNLFKLQQSSPDPETAKLEQGLQKITGLRPKNISIYQTAFTHKSMGLKCEDGNIISYERLEFLGDAILGAIIAIDSTAPAAPSRCPVMDFVELMLIFEA